MTEDNFILKNESQWKKLESYNGLLANKNVGALELSQINEFAELFRSISLNLAYAKTHYPNGRSVPYLNQLAGIAHQHFYLRQKSDSGAVSFYIRKGFARAAGAKKPYVAAAFILFLLGILVSMLLVRADSENASLFLPENYIQAIGRNDSGSQAAAGDINYSLLSAGIMTNNIYVCLTAFAGGVTLGLGTLYILFYNGAVLGALSALAARKAADMPAYLSLILPHGVVELTAIFLSGACGFIIARAILIPGDLKRKDSFIKGAKEAAYFIPGIILMLVAAGLIEGFFTPLPIPPAPKLAFSFAVFVCMAAYYRLALR